MDLPPEIRVVIYEQMFVKRPNTRDPEGFFDVCGLDFWDRYVSEQLICFYD